MSITLLIAALTVWETAVFVDENKVYVFLFEATSCTNFLLKITVYFSWKQQLVSIFNVALY